MGRIIVIGALLVGAYLVLNDSGKVRMSPRGGGSSGAISGYAGASAPAIGGIAGAAG